MIEALIEILTGKYFFKEADEEKLKCLLQKLIPVDQFYHLGPQKDALKINEEKKKKI
jgi:hypothetical protein